MSVPDAMLDPQLRRYRLRRLRLPLAGSYLDLVVPATDGPQHAAAWRACAEGAAAPPYWLHPWPASLLAARWLLQQGDWHGKRVLDLGCGLGLPGVAAASRGADVCFVDCVSDALAFAGWNARRVHPAGRAPTCWARDWTTPPANEAWDVLILADVSYRPAHHVVLWRWIETCLSPGGLVLHIDPHRRESDGFVRSLQQRATARISQESIAAGGRRQVLRMTIAAFGATSSADSPRGQLEPSRGAPSRPTTAADRVEIGTLGRLGGQE